MPEPASRGAVPEPGRFLLSFTLLAALLLTAWNQLSGQYLALLVTTANGALGAAGLPAGLDGSAAAGTGAIVHPEVAGAVALFLTTPRRSWRWRLGWLAPLLVGLAGLHAVLLAGEAWLLLAGAPAAGAPAAIELAGRWLPAVTVAAAWFTAVGASAADPLPS